ncbi:MAG: hypothetical protein UX85_C0003G0140 [Candidatus Beckwithbacteria bacterium GW2011_GWB1_47_15]|uniref:Uncharacterized protein n=1 Tax=Candidatus Beckwithbacteria bacterium GW2011_GWB1_47_15 TaxID=1618371 RepID=A0A0G1RWI1_9BACT|nr:MAG: hypothetical protein UY43_C0001G0324 [Candidatus Beckwithbacteria bacterium GW2011_GWC1_49_16]KKU35241.1 MAG: hypothetical protein UX50_C0005G0064 [Candidatus Beckwithbacteria bacterium GW2011_GWA1_46_30]KKU61481.1 MAG: hypothetical protein UX85_C0003G0140 [Candidatus Beckwithbacteria bacterium GW2011_GWB1_47_15]KKU71685.1 MAG: hypothetical protein UX97_C0004G0008 [Candidatus Beckwithbacteria bacterium GW2011_GWA2_47_25]KKW03783.1 MAG: hypothetical protein UY37_C0004G0076 [Candidatus Be
MNKGFDLEERTAKFGEKVILVKCATSIGANYCEADDAESRKDFKHKIKSYFQLNL